MSKKIKRPDGLPVNRYYIPEDELPISYSGMEIHLKDLAGKVLTIVDASYSDQIQRKAIKDLVKKEFGGVFRYFQEMCFQGNKGHGVVIE